MIGNNTFKRMIRCSWKMATVMNTKRTDIGKNKPERLMTNLNKGQCQDNDISRQPHYRKT